MSPATPTPTPPRRFSVLNRDGVMLVLEHNPDSPAAVLHWGEDLGPLDDELLAALSAVESRTTPPQTVESALQVPLVPQESDGWAGRPGLSVRRDGLQLFPHWKTVGVTGGGASSPGQLALELEDARSGLALRLQFAIEHGGLVAITSTLENVAGGILDVDWLEAVLPDRRAARHLGRVRRLFPGPAP